MQERPGTPGKKALEEKKPNQKPFLCIFLHFQKPRGESQLWELFSVKNYIESAANTLISKPLVNLIA